MAFKSKQHFVEGAKYPLALDAQQVPPVSCQIKPGDRVIFTNDYGVTFTDLLVTGFSPDIDGRGRFVYIDASCWWFPFHPGNLQLQQRNKS